MDYRIDGEIEALGRIHERCPDVTKEDAIHAWRFCITSMSRLDKEPEDYPPCVRQRTDLDSVKRKYGETNKKRGGAWLTPLFLPQCAP